MAGYFSLRTVVLGVLGLSLRKTSLLRRLQAQIFSDATPPTGKIQPSSSVQSAEEKVESLN